MTDKQFYNSKRWLRLRAAILQRDGYKCQMSLRQGKSVPAVTVHHIFPRSEYPEYQWCEWNLISLSLSAHNKLHVRDTDKLTLAGKLLMEEVAKQQGIKVGRGVYLVIGFPHSGKTTWTKRNLKNGVCYDLDAIAGALRLKGPKQEEHKMARVIANKLFPGFSALASTYCDRVIVIRTAPTIEEVQSVNPSVLVICRGGYGNDELSPERRAVIAKRISDAELYCKSEGIEVIENDTAYYTRTPDISR